MRAVCLPNVRAPLPQLRRSPVCFAKLQMAEIKAMSEEEIDSKVTELKTELFFIRMAQAAREPYKSSDIPLKRRNIARLLTVKRQREIEQGITKRQSRQMEKQRLAEQGLL